MTPSTRQRADLKWIVSEYLDDGEFGILNARNQIVVRISEGFSREELDQIVALYNGLVEKRCSKAGRGRKK